MLTVVQFNETGETPTGGHWSNRIYTRTLRKIGFIDNRLNMDPASAPQPREHWLVKVLRENRRADGKGCLILRPIKKIQEFEQTPLLHGEYRIEHVDDVVVLHPPDPHKFWVFSPSAKDSIIKTTNANVIVICHGGKLWSRRQAAETFLEQEARKLFVGE